MPFCSNCGKPLADGEVCNCQNDTINTTASAEPVEVPAEPVVTETVEALAAEPVVTETVEAPVTEPVVTETVEALAAEPVEAPTVELSAAPQPAQASSMPVSEPVSQSTAASQSLALATPNKNNNKTVLAIIAGIIVIAVIAIIILVVPNLFGGSKNPVEDVLKKVNEKETNISAIIDAAFPDFIADKYDIIEKALKDSDDFADNKEEVTDKLEDTYDDIEDEFGKKWSIEFDSKKSDLDEDELDDIAELYEELYEYYFEDIYDIYEGLDDDDIEDFADSMDISEKNAKKYVSAVADLAESFEDIKITDGYELKGKFVITSKDDETKSDKVTINVIKINGEWAIDYLSLYDDLGINIYDLLISLIIY